MPVICPAGPEIAEELLQTFLRSPKLAASPSLKRRLELLVRISKRIEEGTLGIIAFLTHEYHHLDYQNQARK